MNWFKNLQKAEEKRKEQEGKRIKEQVKKKSMEAEIRHLWEAKTSRANLEMMFSPEDVARVILQIDKEKAILQMLETEAAAAASAHQPQAEQSAKLEEIVQLYQAGTSQEVLEQMYVPGDVQKAIQRAKTSEETATTEEEPDTTTTEVDVTSIASSSRNNYNTNNQDDQDPSSSSQPEHTKMSAQEQATLVTEIQQMLLAQTEMVTMESLYDRHLIQMAQGQLQQIQREEQFKKMNETVQKMKPHSKLVLQLGLRIGSSTSSVQEMFKNPIFHVSSQTKEGIWKLVFKSNLLVDYQQLQQQQQQQQQQTDNWSETRISLNKLLNWQNNLLGENIETPLRIELLQESNNNEKYVPVGHADTTLPELMKQAIRSNNTKINTNNNNVNDDDPLEGLEILDRKQRPTQATLRVQKAEIVTRQETPEERTAKTKISKIIAKLEPESKVTLTLKATGMEEEAHDCQPFVRIETVLSNYENNYSDDYSVDDNDDYGKEQVIYTSEPLPPLGESKDSLQILEWKPIPFSCSKLLTDNDANGLPRLRISMLDWNHGKIPKAMGSFVATLEDLLWKAESNKVSFKLLDEEDRTFPCIDETYDEEYGSIIVRDASIQKMSSEEKSARADIAELLQNRSENARLMIDLRGTDIQTKEAVGLLFEVRVYSSSTATSGDWVTIYTSETIKNNLRPSWRKCKLPLDKLLPQGGGDISSFKLQLSLHEWDDKGKRKAVGSAEATVDELLLRSETSIAARAMANELPFSCCDDLGHTFGSLIVVDADIEEETEEEKKARLALTSSLEQIDQYSTLTLSLKGTSLANMDGMFGVSDPFYFVLTPGESEEDWNQVYRSEHVDDNANPQWKTARIPLNKLIVDKDLTRKVRIAMYDWEASGSHQNMGYFDTSVKELLWRSKSNAAAKAVGEDSPFLCRDDSGAEYGSIVVISSSIHTDTPEERIARAKLVDDLQTKSGNPRLCLYLEGGNMVNMDGIFGASDPFFELQRKSTNGEWLTVYKSEHIDDNHAPKWRKAIVPLIDLVTDPVSETIRIALSDWEEGGIHQPMGYTEVTLMDLLWNARTNSAAVSLGKNRSFPCRDSLGKEYGVLLVSDASIAIDTEEEIAARAAMQECIEKAPTQSNIIFKFKGTDLANVEGFLGCSDVSYIMCCS